MRACDYTVMTALACFIRRLDLNREIRKKFSEEIMESETLMEVLRLEVLCTDENPKIALLAGYIRKIVIALEDERELA